MSDTKAGIGYGSVVEMADIAAPTTFTYIAEVKSITPPSETSDTPDATHMQSPNKRREFVGGLTDPGEFSFDMNLVPGSASDIYLMASAGKRKVVRQTFPTGQQLIFIGVRSGYEKSVPLDDVMTATVTMKVSGDPTLTAIAAPRNLILPTITGTAKVGAVLTVDQGVWAGATDIAYQWQKGGVNIAGATGSTYIPVTGDIAAAITCEVTGTNASFSLMAETVATANVIA